MTAELDDLLDSFAELAKAEGWHTPAGQRGKVLAHRARLRLARPPVRFMGMTQDRCTPAARPARPERGSEDQVRMIQHICYEIGECVHRAVERDRLEQAIRDSPWTVDGSVANALLEACLVHARNLIELLVRPRDRSSNDDVLMQDFPSGAWTPTAGTPAESAAGRCASSHWRMINKHLAHLSWTRINEAPNPVEWRLTPLATDVLIVCEAWRDHLNAGGSPQLADSLTGTMDLARKELEGAGGRGSRGTTTGSTRPSLK